VDGNGLISLADLTQAFAKSGRIVEALEAKNIIKTFSPQGGNLNGIN